MSLHKQEGLPHKQKLIWYSGPSPTKTPCVDARENLETRLLPTQGKTGMCIPSEKRSRRFWKRVVSPCEQLRLPKRLAMRRRMWTERFIRCLMLKKSINLHQSGEFAAGMEFVRRTPQQQVPVQSIQLKPWRKLKGESQHRPVRMEKAKAIPLKEATLNYRRSCWKFPQNLKVHFNLQESWAKRDGVMRIQSFTDWKSKGVRKLSENTDTKPLWQSVVHPVHSTSPCEKAPSSTI